MMTETSRPSAARSGTRSPRRRSIRTSGARPRECAPSARCRGHSAPRVWHCRWSSATRSRRPPRPRDERPRVRRRLATEARDRASTRAALRPRDPDRAGRDPARRVEEVASSGAVSQSSSTAFVEGRVGRGSDRRYGFPLCRRPPCRWCRSQWSDFRSRPPRETARSCNRLAARIGAPAQGAPERSPAERGRRWHRTTAVRGLPRTSSGRSAARGRWRPARAARTRRRS